MGYKIALIGTGNVAWNLARILENSGHSISDLYGRDKKLVKNISSSLFNITEWNSLDMRHADAEVFILAITDQSIAEVAEEIQLPEGSILAHTSGSVSMDKLNYSGTEDYGVFYPLQTFSKGKTVDLDQVPICIEGNTERALSILETLAKSISDSVHPVNSDQRRSIHLAAVFACNFTNHMFTISKEILHSNELGFNILQPLIVETLNKSLEVGPENAQTGPARRKDLETLDKQFKALSNDPEVAEIYRQISQNIIDYYSD